MSIKLYSRYIEDTRVEWELPKSTASKVYHAICKGIDTLASRNDAGLTIPYFGRFYRTYKYNYQKKGTVGKLLFKPSKVLRNKYNGGKNEIGFYNSHVLAKHVEQLLDSKLPYGAVLDLVRKFFECIVKNTIGILGTKGIKRVPKTKYKFKFTLIGFGTFYSNILKPRKAPAMCYATAEDAPMIPATKVLRFTSRI